MKNDNFSSEEFPFAVLCTVFFVQKKIFRICCGNCYESRELSEETPSIITPIKKYQNKTLYINIYETKEDTIAEQSSFP